MPKSKTPALLSAALRHEIRTSDESRYAIAKGSGVDYGVIARFLSSERDIRLETADRIAAHLRLRLVRTK
jgi:hypothetical protein